jgi:hypothetical protein
MTPFFRKQTPMQKLETELASALARVEMLDKRHTAATTALLEAKAKLQRHLKEADLDADEKTTAKLKAALAACMQDCDAYADAVSDLRELIANTEQKIAAEHTVAQRKAASEELAGKLDVVEDAMPDYLEACRRFTAALEAIHHHYEAGAIARFVSNGMSQVEVAAAFAMQELRGMVGAIRDGAAPIPASKPSDEPVAVVEPPPPTQTIWMLRSATFRDHAGVVQYAKQFEDCEMPVEAARRALRRKAAVLVTDPRRRDLKGARGGFHVDPNAADLIDLDDEDTHNPAYVAPVVASDPVASANIRVIDRTAENRTLQIAVPRL